MHALHSDQIADSKPVAVVGIIGTDQVLSVTNLISTHGFRDDAWARHKTYIGGFGADVAIALRAHGLMTHLFTVVGGDSTGDQLITALEKVGITTHAIKAAGRRTTVSHTILENGSRRAFRSSGSASEVWPRQPFSCPTIYEGSFNWLAIGDLQADWDGSVTQHLIEHASSVGMPVSWSPGPVQLHLGSHTFRSQLSKIRLLTLEHDNACSFCRLPIDTPADQAVLTLASHAGEETFIILTDGNGLPTVAFDAHDHRIRISQSVHNPNGTDGASPSDAFHAEVIRGLLEGVAPFQRILDAAGAPAYATRLDLGNGFKPSSASCFGKNISWAESSL